MTTAGTYTIIVGWVGGVDYGRAGSDVERTECIVLIVGVVVERTDGGCGRGTARLNISERERAEGVDGV